ncbi:hypothetical protein X975_19818, partial [Stegodyphus mimosarum]
MIWKRSNKKPKWNCRAEGHVPRNCRTSRGRENNTISQQRSRNEINDHNAGRSWNDSEKPCFKALKTSAVSSNSNGLSINGHIDGVPCNMIIDTGANVTIIRKDLAPLFKDKLIWTPSCVTLQTASGEEMDVEGKLNVNITLGSAAYHHTAFVADTTDLCILGLYFLRKYNVSLAKNNKLLSAFEDMTIDQQKGSSARNADVSSERPCSESCRNCTGVEEKPKTISNSPSQMLIGHDFRLPCDLLFGRPVDAPSSPEKCIQDVQSRFEPERVYLATEKMKTRYNARDAGHCFNGDKINNKTVFTLRLDICGIKQSGRQKDMGLDNIIMWNLFRAN